jgi:NhaA family Na+:H+ antiporter
MSEHQFERDLTKLPNALVDLVAKPFGRFLSIQAAASIVLLLSTVAALVISNSSWRHISENFWETSLGFQFGSMEFARSLRM